MLIPLICIQAAGVIQIAIAATNIPAARIFRYRENIARVSPFVREVFIVQNVFIALTVLGMAALCLALPDELIKGSTLSRSLSGFLATFWGLRLIIQLFFYDAETRRRFRAMDIAFTVLFAYLTILFATASLNSSGLVSVS